MFKDSCLPVKMIFEELSIVLAGGAIPTTNTHPQLSAACPDLFCPYNCACHGTCGYNHVASRMLWPICQWYELTVESQDILNHFAQMELTFWILPLWIHHCCCPSCHWQAHPQSMALIPQVQLWQFTMGCCNFSWYHALVTWASRFSSDHAYNLCCHTSKLKWL